MSLAPLLPVMLLFEPSPNTWMAEAFPSLIVVMPTAYSTIPVTLAGALKVRLSTVTLTFSFPP